MKILIHDYAGHPFQTELSRELARRGHQITHAYFGGDSGPKGLLRHQADDPEGLAFVPINVAGAYNKTNFISRRFKDIEYGKQVASHIKLHDYDLVISGNTPTEAQGKIIQAAKASGAKFLFWVQDFYSIAATSILTKKLGPFGKLVGYYYQALERLQFRRSNGIVIISPAFSKLAHSWTQNLVPIELIENWGPLSGIHSVSKDNRWSVAHGLDRDFVFLYSGTLALKHNPEFLVQLACLRLKNVKIVVVAQGVGVEYLKQKKQELELDHLVILPLQPIESLSDMLASADVLVALIEEDAGKFSVPSKVQSYLCAGRPILLAAPLDNPAAQVVERERAGRVVKPDDIQAFLDAAKELRASDQVRTEFGQNGRSFAIRTFDIQGIADRFEAVFEQAGGPS